MGLFIEIKHKSDAISFVKIKDCLKKFFLLMLVHLLQ